ncbi:MAG: hypothetical protein B7Y40_07770 [Gammaproteobacteria bacterium 28-57-27]|nr:MAG: hypothetical protein B7Y40_07770 [Gammaproteobacteria bacterium 28-57-27]
MQTLSDFLSFKAFISPSVLMFCYYFGALGVPLVAAVMLALARQKARERGLVLEKATLWASLATQQNIVVVATLFVLMFLCMEIGWRMMFEFMLAYFQMREALLGLSY